MDSRSFGRIVPLRLGEIEVVPAMVLNFKGCCIKGSCEAALRRLGHFLSRNHRAEGKVDSLLRLLISPIRTPYTTSRAISPVGIVKSRTISVAVLPQASYYLLSPYW